MLRRSALIVSTLATLLLAGCVTVNYSPPASSPSRSAPPSASSASPSPSTETFTPGAPANQCLTANLSVSLEDEGASAGHLHAKVVFTNNGPDCVLKGFPTVQVAQGAAPIGAGSEEDSSAAVAPVTLMAGGSAIAQLTSVNIDPGGGPLGDSCVVDHGTGYLVTPPHSTTPIPVDVPNVPACTNGIVWMTAGPVTAP
ncbi:MAG: DUF4232 domain-containing protein [Cryobacterium sp.]|nr:DUF4232 domain-containing protein [Cryobacterium sp.]